MSGGIDDRLRRGLERLARPADPSGAFDGILEKRARGQHRRVQVIALTVAVVIGTAGATYGLARVFGVGEPGGDPISAGSPMPSPLPWPTDECRTSSVSGDFDGDDVEDTATVALTSCLVPEPEEGSPYTTEYALDVKWPPAQGIFPVPDCGKICRALAAVDFDGDGTDEFVLVVDASATREFLQFYRLPPRETGPVRLEVAPPGETDHPAGQPLRLPQGAPDADRDFVTCRMAAGGYQLIATNAAQQSRGEDVQVTVTSFSFDGTRFAVDPPERQYFRVEPGDVAASVPGEPCW
jgi:hypothetical protein